MQRDICFPEVSLGSRCIITSTAIYSTRRHRNTPHKSPDGWLRALARNNRSVAPQSSFWGVVFRATRVTLTLAALSITSNRWSTSYNTP
jgi:hypothetical protein